MRSAWIPAACSRLRIFISYSSENHPLADEIAQQLKNEGHDVFFDKDSLPPGEEYNERIRQALRLADRCIFLVGKHSVEPGKYMLTEIDFAKARWPVPAGRVLPVLIDPELKPRDLPVYLRSVNAITPKGSIAAELAAAIDRSRELNSTCRLCLVLALAGAVMVAALGAWLVLRPLAPAVDIVLLPIEKVHFRPRAAPPPDLLAPDAPTDWIESPLTVTAMKVTYSRRDRGGAVANLLREEIELRLGASFSRYQWSYVVDINRERGCPDDWLCRKESVEVKALGPGGTSRPRETMFLPVSDRPLTWRDYIDQVLSPQGSDVITVKLLSAIDLAGSGKQDTVLEFVCTLDVRAARAEFLRAGGESAARILAATLHRQAARIELTRAERGRAMKISDRLMARSPRRRS